MDSNNNYPAWVQSPIGKVVTALLIALTVFIAVEIVQALVSFNVPSDQPATNVITVNGKAEVLAKPDIATVSFSVFEESSTIAAAQKIVTDKTNKAFDFLKKSGVEEKDIKTTGYNIYPQYDYVQGVCKNGYCPSGRQVLRGYEVRQSVDVKIRDISKSGALLSGLTDTGVNTVSNISFSIDKEDDLAAQARKQAIDEAKQKAEVLAKDLGVRLVRIVSFNESNGGYPVPMYANAKVMGMGGATNEVRDASIPTGENTITSNVTISYEIR